jgi:hypothetical protein
MFNAGGAILAEEHSYAPRAQTSSTGSVTTASSSSVAAAAALHVSLDIKGSGRFLAYCTAAPAAVTLDGVSLQFTHSLAKHTPDLGGAGDIGSSTGPGSDQVQALEVVLSDGYTGATRKLEIVWPSSSSSGVSSSSSSDTTTAAAA